jgi:hypothetical protein
VEDGAYSPDLSQNVVNHLQQLGGTLMYYPIVLDTTLIIPVNVLASEKTRETSDTADKTIKLLNYCNTHPEATLHYHASDMIINIHSEVSHLSDMESKIQAGGFLYMGSNTDKTNRLTNGSILIIGTVHKYIMVSAGKVNNSPLYHTRRTGASSPPKTLETDNTTATGYINGTVKQTCTRAMDMHFYLVKCKVKKASFMFTGAQDTKI